MNEPAKARVGLSGLMFDLYDAWLELKSNCRGAAHLCPGHLTLSALIETRLPVHVLRDSLQALMDVRASPILLAFSLEPGDATLTSLSTGVGCRLKLVATEGNSRRAAQ